ARPTPRRVRQRGPRRAVAHAGRQGRPARPPDHGRRLRRGAGVGPERGPDLRGRGVRRSRPGHAAVRDGARGPRNRAREGAGRPMRLTILDRGHAVGTKLLFALLRAFTRQPVPDAVKLVSYRPDFYGTPMKELTHEAMRGPSAWSVGDRELMA